MKVSNESLLQEEEEEEKGGREREEKKKITELYKKFKSYITYFFIFGHDLYASYAKFNRKIVMPVSFANILRPPKTTLVHIWHLPFI